MPRIYSRTKLVSDLTSTERATIYGLLALEFLGTRPEDFARDLEEKEAVALLRCDSPEGEIVGFSTLMVLDLPVPGRMVKGVFSGDTTVLAPYRNTGGIGIEVGYYFMKALEDFPEHEIFYILITKGWRTYKVMPFFFKTFSPKHDATTPQREQEVMDAFGKKKYPKEYNPETGLIMFSKETQRLIPGSIDAIPMTHPDAHVAFFLERNPTYLSGTELVCVGEVALANFAAPLKKLLKNGRA